jgi:hypothetical protein
MDVALGFGMSSRLVRNPGAAANYTSKKKKGFKKEKGVKAFLLKKEPI